MEQKLIIKQPESAPDNRDIIIELTDIQFHTSARITGSIGKHIQHAVEKHQPGRIYFPMQTDNAQTENEVTPGVNLQNPALLKMIQEYQSQGKRVFIKSPTSSLPASLGQDTVQFINSVKGKRILRRIEKSEN